MTEYKLVPVEPTAEMQEAGKYALEAGCYASGIYADMLADSPAINIVATKNEQGQIVCVTLQDEDHHHILQVIAEAAVQGEPVVWLRFRSHRVAADDVIEGLEICEPGEIGDDGGPAFPVYASQQPAEQQPTPDVAELMKALEISVNYLDQSDDERIHSGSIAHNKMRDALAIHHKGGDAQ